MADKTGGPAFPQMDAYVDVNGERPVYVADGGMTLRDYFAAKAFPAIYTEFWRTADSCDPDWERGLAMDAYRIADAIYSDQQKAGT